MRLILFGEPGAGKGTLSAMLQHRVGVKHVSTGDIFRHEISRGTDLGKLASGYLSKGHLVPDDVVLKIVAELFQDAEFAKGFVLDGFPRTVAQAKALDLLLMEKGWTIDGIIRIKVDSEELARRLSSRRVCRSCGAIYNLVNFPPKVKGVCDKCGGQLYQREDDYEDAVKIRLHVYDTQTAPVLDYFKGHKKLVEIDTTGDDAESSYVKLFTALGATRARG